MSGAITLKLTSLLIRTVAKPIANTIKAQSKQSNFLKTNFIRFGQFINRVDLTLRNSSNSTLKIRPLTDNKAIELGSNFLSELFVFSIAAGLIIYESTRSKGSSKPEPVEVAPPEPSDKVISTLQQEMAQLKHQNSTILEELEKLKQLNQLKESNKAVNSAVDKQSK